MTNPSELGQSREPSEFINDALANAKKRFGNELGFYCMSYLIGLAVDAPKKDFEKQEKQFAEAIATAMEGTHEDRVKAMESLLTVTKFVAKRVREVEGTVRRKTFIEGLKEAGLT